MTTERKIQQCSGKPANSRSRFGCVCVCECVRVALVWCMVCTRHKRFDSRLPVPSCLLPRLSNAVPGSARARPSAHTLSRRTGCQKEGGRGDQTGKDHQDHRTEPAILFHPSGKINETGSQAEHQIECDSSFASLVEHDSVAFARITRLPGGSR